MNDSKLAQARDRLSSYADDLERRFIEQKAWQDRNPGINPFDHTQYTDEFHERDPYPLTNDLITAQRFLDIINIALAAFNKGDVNG
jgi:hypothetical protein